MFLPGPALLFLGNQEGLVELLRASPTRLKIRLVGWDRRGLEARLYQEPCRASALTWADRWGALLALLQGAP